MKLHVMSLFDKKARAFAQPFFVTHSDMAVRALGNAANDRSLPVGKNPEDYCLYLLGTWDDEGASFELTSIPVLVVDAIQLKKAEHVQSKAA